MFVFNNDIIGGLALDKCVHVKEWSESQLTKLNCGLVRGKEIFLEQNGYMYLAR